MIRVLVHACATAAVLALIGSVLAEFAGLFVESQTSRAGPEYGNEVRSTVARTLPITLAAGGFFVVFVGETLMAIWKNR